MLDEVMRLSPPIPVIARKALRADEVSGERVSKGAIVRVAPFIIAADGPITSFGEISL